MILILSLSLLAIVVAKEFAFRDAAPAMKTALKVLGYGCLGALALAAFFTHDAIAGSTAALGILYTAEQLPATSQEAITVFMENYIAGAAQAPIQTWANRFGDQIPLASPIAKFPMSLLSLAFQDSTGENRFKDMKEQSFELLVSEKDEGIEADLLLLTSNVFAYRKWADGPSLLRDAEARFILRAVARTIIEANQTCAWDGLPLFNDSHVVNPAKGAGGGTFDNNQATTKNVADVTNLEAETTLMMQEAVDTNGERLIDTPSWAVLVPTAKYQPLQNLLKKNFIANDAGTATISNPYGDGTIEAVHVPQFTDVNDWYIIEQNLLKRYMAPWLVGTYEPSAELALRTFDTNSDFFKNTGKIAVSKHIWNGVKALFPHAIRKVAGA